jgi:hypothetical protein
LTQRETHHLLGKDAHEDDHRLDAVLVKKLGDKKAQQPWIFLGIAQACPDAAIGFSQVP